MKSTWLFDTTLTPSQAKGILSRPDDKRFISTAALLLQRVNEPKKVFEQLSKEDFARTWTRIKKQMRRNKWASPRIDFWQSVYKVVAVKLKSKGVDVYQRKERRPVDDLCASLGAQIRDARKEAGKTQADLSHAMNVSQQMISQLEKGYENVSVLTLKRVAQALGRELSIKVLKS